MISKALSLYSGAPPQVRAHVWGRWATCPFPKVAAAVPERGRVLEIGCGYGLFSCHLALTSPQREVLGVDVDVDKIVHGRFAAEKARNLGAECELHLEPPGEVPEGPWDAVVIVDVLYLLDPDAQAGLLHSCAEQLALGGVLVVKEMASSPRWKARWNAVQETLAVRVLRITTGDQLVFLEPEVLGAWMESAGLKVTHEPLDHRYPHPHHLMVGARRRSIDGQRVVS
ncbi:MAG: methyltransferase domain-containing protein [Acidimicrobiales bacterium]